MSKAANGDEAAAKAPEDFEASLAALEETVAALETGDLPLEEALKRFEEGTRLLRRCEAALKRAEQRIEILLKEDKDAQPEPFESDD
ncbi:MAG TPA: exodeoxyribonuclease VII small subunit [Gammaproteobacteria bacterium]|nr:exodeoxyribonuclease VII small subunit [Gammaproteobacteria bacterium]